MNKYELQILKENEQDFIIFSFLEKKFKANKEQRNACKENLPGDELLVCLNTNIAYQEALLHKLTVLNKQNSAWAPKESERLLDAYNQRTAESQKTISELCRAEGIKKKKSSSKEPFFWLGGVKTLRKRRFF